MRKNFKQLLAFVTVLLMAVTMLVPFGAFAVYPADPFYVDIVASKTSLAPGDTFNVTISFKNIPSYGITGSTVNLPIDINVIDTTAGQWSYTPAVATTTQNKGAFNSGTPKRFVNTYTDLTQGTVAIPTDNGSGKLIGTFTFKIKATATAGTTTKIGGGGGTSNINASGFSGYDAGVKQTISPINLNTTGITLNIVKPVTGVTLTDKPAGTVKVGDTGTLGVTVDPSDASDKTVTWSATGSLSVTSGGVWTANSTGAGSVTATANDGSGKSDTWSVDVIAAGPTAPSLASLTLKAGTVVDDKFLTLTLGSYVGTQSYQVWLEQISANGTSFGWVLLKGYADNFTSAAADATLDFKVETLSPQYRIYVRYKLEGGTAQVATQLFKLAETTEPVIESLTCTGGTQSNGVVYDTFVADKSYDISLASSGATSVKWYLNGIEVTGTSNAYTFVSTTAGTHTVTVEVANGSLKTTKSIRFALYNADAPFVALEANSNNFGSVVNGTGLMKNINLDLTSFGLLKSNGLVPSYKFAYGEPSKGYQNSTAFGAGTSYSFSNVNYPGIYNIFGYISAQGKNTAEDYIIRSVKVSRPAESVAVTTDYTLVGGTYTITATGSGLASGAYQYSFWRVDANGYNLVKAWSSDNVLTWAPVRDGNYKILVRVRGANGLDGTPVPASKGTYEVQKALEFTKGATSAFDSITDSNLSASGTLEKNKPITLTVSDVTDETAVYQFLVDDVNRGTSVIRAFSNSNTCTWVPNKSGEYTIIARINRGAAFGFADKEIQISVTVN